MATNVCVWWLVFFFCLFLIYLGFSNTLTIDRFWEEFPTPGQRERNVTASSEL